MLNNRCGHTFPWLVHIFLDPDVLLLGPTVTVFLLLRCRFPLFFHHSACVPLVSHSHPERLRVLIFIRCRISQKFLICHFSQTFFSHFRYRLWIVKVSRPCEIFIIVHSVLLGQLVDQVRILWDGSCSLFKMTSVMKALIGDKLVLGELDLCVSPLLDLLVHRIESELHFSIYNSYFRCFVNLSSLLIGRRLFHWNFLLLFLFSCFRCFYFSFCCSSSLLLSLLSLGGFSFDSFCCCHRLC